MAAGNQTFKTYQSESVNDLFQESDGVQFFTRAEQISAGYAGGTKTFFGLSTVTLLVARVSATYQSFRLIFSE